MLRLIYYIVGFALYLASIVQTQQHIPINISMKELNYTTSVASMETLLRIEKQLIDNLKAYEKLLEEKVNIMRHALKKMKEENEKSKSNPEAYLSNPINSFSLIRRMHSDWLKWQIYMNETVGQAQIDFIGELKPILPTKMDMNEAVAGIKRLQSVYLLQAKDIAVGFLNGKQYDGKLSSADCFAIGNYYDKRKEIVEASDWFKIAYIQYDESEAKLNEILGVGPAEIWYMIADKWLDLERPDESLIAIETALSYKPNDTKVKKFFNDLKIFINHEKLCRGESEEQSTKHLHCRFNNRNSQFLRLAPLKMEELSLDPSILLYHDVVYENEIQELKSISLKNLKRGLVGGGVISADRTVKSFYFPNHVPLAERIARRIRDMTGANAVDADPLQVMNYGLGGHHYSHVDNSNLSLNKSNSHLGKRSQIVLFYMNNVQKGGSTIFVELNLIQVPKKGAAVVFDLLDNAGNNDYRTRHASCPVVLGSKWCIVQILYENPQIFLKPCLKNEGVKRN